MQSVLFRASQTRLVPSAPCLHVPRRFSSWFAADRGQSDNGSWYNPNATSPKKEGHKTISNSQPRIQRPVFRHTSTNPPRAEHCQGYYTFFKDLEHGFKHIAWPKNDESKYPSDWMDGFRVIENYISQKEHDKFLAEVMEYAQTSHKVTHFDGRLVMNEMDTDFYPLFFNRLVDDGILEGPDRLAPNIYANGDGIPPHFDSIPLFIIIH